MAKVNHTNVFATVNPNVPSTADWTTQQELLNAKNREEINLLEQRKQAEAERRRKMYDDRMKEFGNLSIPEGFKTNSVNEILTGYVTQAIETQGKLGREYEKAVANNDVRKMNEIKMKQQELNNTGKYLKTALQSYEEQGVALQKGLSDGSILMTDQNRKRLNSIADGGLQVFIGEDMKPMFAFRDTNGDGKINELDILSLDELINSQEGGFFGETVRNFDMESYTTQVANALKPKKTDKTTGYTTTTIEEVPDEVISRYTLSGDQLKALGLKRGLDITDPEVINNLNKEYQDTIRSKTRFSETEKFDSTRYSTDMRESRERRNEDTKTNGISYVEKVQHDSPSLDDNREHFAFNTPYQLKDKKTGMAKDGYLSGIVLDKNGSITLSGEELYGKRKKVDDDDVETTENVYRAYNLTDKKDVQSILSEVLGTKSYEESVKALRSRVGNSGGETNTTEAEQLGI